MPPVGAAVAGLLGIGGGALTFGGIGTALIKVAAGMGLSYVAKALAGKPEDLLGGDQGRPSGVQATLISGDSLPRAFIIGKYATAGRGVYLKPWGETNKTPHAYLVQVVALSDLPITGVRNIYVDDQKITWPAGAEGPRGYAVPEFRKNGIDYLWIKVHLGGQGSADAYLVDKFQSAGARDWTNNHVGKGVAYAIITSRYSEKLYDGRPECLFVIDGIPLYDPTKDVSIGGTHNWNNPATFTWSANPAVMIYNIMRGIRQPFLTPSGPGGANEYAWVYGLQTVAAAQLPLSSWNAAINECELEVTNRDGSKNAQFRAGGDISYNTEAGAEIEELLKACNGRIADCGGIYKIKVGAASSVGTPVFTFTDDNLMTTDAHEFAMFPPLDEVINGIDATFVAPGDAWSEKALPPKHREAFIDQDDRRHNIADISYRRVWDKAQAQRLSQAILKESRRFRRHVIVLPPEAYVVEPLDFVQWTSSRNGYTDKLFRVESVSDLASGDQVLGIQEVDPTDYDWTPADEAIIPDGVQAIDVPPPQAIFGFAASGQISAGGDGRSIAVIRVGWTAADLDDVDKVMFEVRLAPGGAIVCRTEMHAPEIGFFDIANGINGATSYEVRAIFDDVNGHRDFTWSAWLPVTTPNTKIVANEILGSLITLINQGSAAGKVITEQVLPAPAGFQTLYRITVYGSGASPVASGMYLYVTTTGIPGVIFDAAQFAVGPFSSVPADVATKAKVFPFLIENGIVKLKRGLIQKLQAGQIDANAIRAEHLYADKLDVYKIKAVHIAGGEMSELLGTGSALNAAVTVRKKGGVVLVGNFHYIVDRNDRMKIGIVKPDGSVVKNSTWNLEPNADMEGIATVVGVDTKGSGDRTYTLKKLSGSANATFNQPQLVALRVLD